MRKFVAAVVFAAGILSCPFLAAAGAASVRGESSPSVSAFTKSASSHGKTSTRKSSKKKKATGVPRDTHGRIQRSEAAKEQFMRQTGYPHGRKGYVVDHIVPLACGGADVPSNMQWQTVVEAKAKDRTERLGC